MRLDAFMISLLVFSVIVVSGTLLMVDLNEHYTEVGVNLSQDDFGDSYNQVSELYNISKSLESSVSGGETDSDSTEDSLFKGGFNAARQGFLSIFVVPGTIIKDVAKTVGIPAIFVTATIAAFLIILSFAIIYLIFRFQPR